jgi:hypothetical protein
MLDEDGDGATIAHETSIWPTSCYRPWIEHCQLDTAGSARSRPDQVEQLQQASGYNAC